jgi:RNA polymerase sigma factor (sigma-70 family)
MNEHGRLVERFEEQRAHLRAVAYRMLGSLSEAEDAVQETWLRLSRADADGVENLCGWMTTIVSRVCLDLLRSRTSRREELVGSDFPDEVVNRADGIDPEQEAMLADALGPALLVVLDTLAPAERLAFVLHDLFAVPFDEIARILGRNPAAARQLASRARRRVQGADADPDADLTRQREIVDAFLAASRTGDFAALLSLLDPDIVLRADRTSVDAAAARRTQGAPALMSEVYGATAIAEVFSGGARAARPALIDGAAGAVWATGGQPRAVFEFTIVHGKIVAIDMFADPEYLSQLDLTILPR